MDEELRLLAELELGELLDTELLDTELLDTELLDAELWLLSDDKLLLDMLDRLELVRLDSDDSELLDSEDDDNELRLDRLLLLTDDKELELEDSDETLLLDTLDTDELLKELELDSVLSLDDDDEALLCELSAIVNQSGYRMSSLPVVALLNKTACNCSRISMYVGTKNARFKYTLVSNSRPYSSRVPTTVRTRC